MDFSLASLIDFLSATWEWLASMLSSQMTPAWFSALGTVGAFSVAVVILKREMNDRKRHRQKDREAAARRVSVWIKSREADYTIERRGGIYSNDPMHSVVVRNLGDEPIYNAHVYLGTIADNLREFEFDESHSSSVHSHIFYLVPPGEDCVEGDKRITVPERTTIGVEFTDANGVSWWRQGGTLEEISERRPYDYGALSVLQNG